MFNPAGKSAHFWLSVSQLPLAALLVGAKGPWFKVLGL